MFLDNLKCKKSKYQNYRPSKLLGNYMYMSVVLYLSKSFIGLQNLAYRNVNFHAEYNYNFKNNKL